MKLIAIREMLVFLCLIIIPFSNVSAEEPPVQKTPPSRKIIFQSGTKKETRTYSVMPFILSGLVSDSYGKQSAGTGGAGVKTEYYFHERFFFSGILSHTIYSQIYYYFPPTNETVIQSSMEQMTELGLHGGLIVLKNRWLTLSPLLGIHGDFLLVKNFSNTLIGPSAGFDIKFPINDSIRIDVNALYTYDLLNEGADVKKPVSGYPYSVLNYSAIVKIQRFFLGYDGKYFLYPRVERIDGQGNRYRYSLNNRLYHSVILGAIF